MLKFSRVATMLALLTFAGSHVPARADIVHFGADLSAFDKSARLIPFHPNNSIQADLINPFPVGHYRAGDVLKTHFFIPSRPAACGFNGASPCNMYDGFDGQQGATLVIPVSNVWGAREAYTLMNAYSPPPNAPIATVEFVGSRGATQTFTLVGGVSIRDFYQGNYANTLSNGVPGLETFNAYTCSNPGSCEGGGGTGNVQTGFSGTYNVDEQHYVLAPRFRDQQLIEIIITDATSGTTPVLMGVSVKT